MVQNNWLLEQHNLLKIALEATDAYLGIEKQGKATGIVTNTMLHDFSFHMSKAHEALQQLGVLDEHQKYMTKHVKIMTALHGHDDTTISDLPYAHVPKADYGEVEEQAKKVWEKPSPVKKSTPLTPQQKAKAKAAARSAGRPYPNMVDNIRAARNEGVMSFASFILSEENFEEVELTESDIDNIVNNLTWEDIVELYDDSELYYEEANSTEEVLLERLTVQSRLKKRQSFARMKGKRGVARNIKLRRASSMEVLKKRAVVAARRAMYSRLLRGRDKSSLSASEKDRLEQQVARLKTIQQSLAVRLLPKMRSIEQKRIANYRTKSGSKLKAPKLKPSKLKAIKRK